MIFELVILTYMNGCAYDIFGITSRNFNFPTPIGLELVSKHASEELKASSEVPRVLLGLVLRFSLGSWFPYRFESEDHAISLSSWFPHRFEFEDHARPWFCPKLRFSLSSWFPYTFESEDHARP